MQLRAAATRRQREPPAKAQRVQAECRPGDQRPVLIGTRSIDKSELLAALLDEVGLEYQLLNANHLATEAEIVAAAGQGVFWENGSNGKEKSDPTVASTGWFFSTLQQQP